jgi:hypothetical protein
MATETLKTPIRELTTGSTFAGRDQKTFGLSTISLLNLVPEAGGGDILDMRAWVTRTAPFSRACAAIQISLVGRGRPDF